MKQKHLQDMLYIKEYLSESKEYLVFIVEAERNFRKCLLQFNEAQYLNEVQFMSECVLYMVSSCQEDFILQRTFT